MKWWWVTVPGSTLRVGGLGVKVLCTTAASEVALREALKHAGHPPNATVLLVEAK